MKTVQRLNKMFDFTKMEIYHKNKKIANVYNIDGCFRCDCLDSKNPFNPFRFNNGELVSSEVILDFLKKSFDIELNQLVYFDKILNIQKHWCFLVFLDNIYSLFHLSKVIFVQRLKLLLHLDTIHIRLDNWIPC